MADRALLAGYPWCLRGWQVKSPILQPQFDLTNLLIEFFLGWWDHPMCVPYTTKYHKAALAVIEQGTNTALWPIWYQNKGMILPVDIKIYCGLNNMAHFFKTAFLKKTISWQQTFVFWSSLKFVPKGLIHNRSAFVYIMAYHWIRNNLHMMVMAQFTYADRCVSERKM